MPLQLDNNIKFKYLTFDELVINLDRLSRFKNPEESFYRVFSEIIFKCLITPKYSKNEIDNLSPEVISNIILKIWNESVKKLFGTKKKEINNILENHINYAFKNYDERTKIFISTKLIITPILEKLDYNNIPNFDKYFDNEKYGHLIENGIKDYGVIYNVGTTILIYNKNLVKEAPTSWNVLWDEQYKGKVLMFNNPRDSFAIAQFVLGQSINTTEKEDWDAAAALLMEQRQKVKPEYVMDEVFIKMESGEYAFATYYAGDYELMVENNPDLGFAFPQEGVNTFYDAMCIPSASQNKKGAEAFINFMLEPEIALANAEYIYYATPNKAVLENEDYSLIDSEAVYPETVVGQAFHNLPTDTLQYMNNLWMKVKGENNTQGLYAGFFSVIILVVIIIIANIIKKAKMKKYYNV